MEVSPVALTVESDLNGASPQFTLICISTGGPASTVTWTRDGTPVAEGTRTLLVNTTSAEYIHSLTVTGRLGGLYTCTVTNSKPSSSSADITMHSLLALLRIGRMMGSLVTT